MPYDMDVYTGDAYKFKSELQELLLMAERDEFGGNGSMPETSVTTYDLVEAMLKVAYENPDAVLAGAGLQFKQAVMRRLGDMGAIYATPAEQVALCEERYGLSDEEDA